MQIREASVPGQIRSQSGMTETMLRVFSVQPGQLTVFIGYGKGAGWHLKFNHPKKRASLEQVTSIVTKLREMGILPDALTAPLGLVISPALNLNPLQFELWQIPLRVYSPVPKVK